MNLPIGFFCKSGRIELATDASQTGWGGVISTPVKQETSDYWSKYEMMLDIATREAIAVDKVLHAFKVLVKDLSRRCND